MKMKQIIQIVGLPLLVAITAFCCKKNEDNGDGASKPKKEFLTTGSWKYIGAIISPAYDYYGDGTPVTNIFDIMKTCEKDDFETYKTNGTWEYNEGPTKCDPSYPQVFTMPWNLAANETKLLVGTVEHTILELTATTLKLRYTFEDAAVIYTEEDTYEH
jgi:hypothetical protein